MELKGVLVVLAGFLNLWKSDAVQGVPASLPGMTLPIVPMYPANIPMPVRPHQIVKPPLPVQQMIQSYQQAQGIPSVFDPYRNSFRDRPLQWWSRDLDFEQSPLRWWSKDMDFEQSPLRWWSGDMNFEQSPLRWWSRDMDFQNSFYPYAFEQVALPVKPTKPHKNVKAKTTAAPATGSILTVTTNTPAGAQQQTTAATPTTTGATAGTTPGATAGTTPGTTTIAVPTPAAGISTNTQPQTTPGTTQPPPLLTTRSPTATTHRPIVTTQTPGLAPGQTTPAPPAALSSAGPSSSLSSTSSSPPRSVTPSFVPIKAPGIVSLFGGGQTYFVPPKDGSSGVKVFMTGPGSFSGSSGSGGSFVTGTGNMTLVNPGEVQSLGVQSAPSFPPQIKDMFSAFSGFPTGQGLMPTW
ncbi:mucin-2-like [Macrobrachium nipponense]|uniref:mucin-2-like n=1 Tax=Macrobrachium nipponense TaxID=159736 RepID=UPI0030C7E9F9